MNTLLDNNPDLFKVYEFNNKIRLGKTIDSGYVIGNLDIDYDCYISAGIGENDEFSLDFMNKYNINKNNSYAFDGTIEQEPLNLRDKITFVKKNIGSINDEKMSNLSYLYDTHNNIFLKMDIEGGEWHWLSSIDENKLIKFAQIVIEFHGLTNVSYHGITMHSFNCEYSQKVKCLEKLSRTHYLVHAHGNNCDMVAQNGVPNVMELVYINKNNFDFVPELNTQPLPIKDLDFPNDILYPDIDLNFFPFVHKEIEQNPFLIDIQDKNEYTIEDYINIQNQLNNKNIDDILEKMYSSMRNNFYTLKDFKFRISRGIRQKIIDTSQNLLPVQNLFKIGNGGDNKNCIVSCTPFFTNDNTNTRFIASQQILKSLEKSGFNGYFYLFNGGFPNPTGTEMKYAGVPYCFKVFMMLEAHKKGFTNIIWIDSGCYALNNPEPLFDILTNKEVLLCTMETKHYDAMVLPQTMRLLNQITCNNIYNARYVLTVVFGLNFSSLAVKKIIDEYYEMVKLGWPFFSIFPEEIVLSSIFNKPEYKLLLNSSDEINKLQINEKLVDEDLAKCNGFYFHHKDYSKYENTNKNKIRYVTFDNTGGRFGNQLFRYVLCKVFTARFGHKYISREKLTNDDFIIINEENINDFLENKQDVLNEKNVVLQGYFQKSELFVAYQKQIIDLVYDTHNEDYWQVDNKNYFVKDFIINSKHNISLKPNDVVIHLRLDDFIQYPCVTSDILPPQYYTEILEKMKITSGTVYIICDKIKYDWEFKYIEFFNKWKPVVIQETLHHDIALMRDSNILVHSNSSLCWIISFLSNKIKRIIPCTLKQISPNTDLKLICQSDMLKYVNQLTHNEVHNLDVNDLNILPLSFCIPDECIVNEIPRKSHLLAPLLPGDISTYIYDNEKDYNDMYQKSRFAITKMKGGWDCLRHYEILMNGCIPLFENLQECPAYTLTTYPKELNNEAYELYNNWIENDECIQKYNALCSQFLEHTKNNCTTSSTTKYFLDNIQNGDKIKNILLITCHNGINYNRESLWIGLKRYIKSINGVAVEYEKIPFLYDDFDINSNNNYARCFTYPKRIQKDAHYNMSENEILEKINTSFWDLIIYGKVGPDEFCTFPYFDIVKSKYNKNNIVFLFGGDEIFNLKITDCHSYHKNMFGVSIYYKPYSDYLNYYKQFGKCFVRELEK